MYEGLVIHLARSGDNISEHFTYGELADPRDGTLILHTGFLDHLEHARRLAGRPFIVNSCCRTPASNKRVGGHPRSLHLTDNPVHPTTGAMAIDISTATWEKEEVHSLIDKLWAYGWSYGIGANYSFLHLDMRISIGLPQTWFEY